MLRFITSRSSNIEAGNGEACEPVSRNLRDASYTDRKTRKARDCRHNRAVTTKANHLPVRVFMKAEFILLGLTALFTAATLFFGTKNGYYDTDNYHGNGSAH